MRYRVKLFAALRERTGLSSWECQSEVPLTGSQLLQSFFDAHPPLAGLRQVTRLAVNQSFCLEDTTLGDADELAFIPPVSGG